MAWNLYIQESMHWLTLSWIGRQFIFSNSLTVIIFISPSSKQNLMHLFWAACKRVFKFLLRLGYQAFHAKSKKGYIIALHNNLRIGMSTNLFGRQRNLNLEFTLFISQLAIDSPERVSSRTQPQHVTFEYCFDFFTFILNI